jgi:hypothetical protein
MTKWDGHERRMTTEQREGRRKSDERCPDHFLLWKHHDEDKESFRELSCGRIKEVKNNLSIEVDKLEKVDAAISTKIDEMNKIVVGKFWFRIVIGAMFASLIYIASQNRLSNNDQTEALKDIAKNQKEISFTVNSIENKQIEMVGHMAIFKLNIDELTRRQDVLRDINIRERKDDGRDGRDGKTGRDGRDSPRP